LIIAGVVLVFAILLVGEFLGGGLDLFTLSILPALSRAVAHWLASIFGFDIIQLAGVECATESMTYGTR
jgi:hypothetical protein